MLDLARGLAEFGVELISTGARAKPWPTPAGGT